MPKKGDSKRLSTMEAVLRGRMFHVRSSIRRLVTLFELGVRCGTECLFMMRSDVIKGDCGTFHTSIHVYIATADTNTTDWCRAAETR